MDSGGHYFSVSCFQFLLLFFIRDRPRQKNDGSRRHLFYNTGSMFFDRKDFSDTVLLDLYRTLLFPRMIEEKMLVLLRQGRISKWFSGIGQEAISAGVVSRPGTG